MHTQRMDISFIGELRSRLGLKWWLLYDVNLICISSSNSDKINIKQAVLWTLQGMAWLEKKMKISDGLNALHHVFHFIFATILWGRYYLLSLFHWWRNLEWLNKSPRVTDLKKMWQSRDWNPGLSDITYHIAIIHLRSCDIKRK